jgi:hypothetical protein
VEKVLELLQVLSQESIPHAQPLELQSELNALLLPRKFQQKCFTKEIPLTIKRKNIRSMATLQLLLPPVMCSTLWNELGDSLHNHLEVRQWSHLTCSLHVIQ